MARTGWSKFSERLVKVREQLTRKFVEIREEFVKPTEIPDEFKPIAIVVASQTDESLQEIEPEVTSVQKTLENANFKVERLSDPDLEGIVSKFSEAAVEHNRIVLFHFAGHSSNDGLELSDTENSKFNFGGLADHLRSQKSLRLVFLNGCSNKEFEDSFFRNEGRTEFEQRVCTIVTKSEIGDGAARVFAERFYHEWLVKNQFVTCLLYTSPSPRDRTRSRMPSSA